LVLFSPKEVHKLEGHQHIIRWYYTLYSFRSELCWNSNILVMCAWKMMRIWC